ncbi:MAG: penicillin-binding transpeptidase domain-containing protein [Anaerolineales bacterium]
MKSRLWIVLLLVFAAGCATDITTPNLLPAPPAQTTPTPSPPLPDPKLVARIYLDAWKVEDYPAMYAWLTPLSQDAVTEEGFTALYRGLAATMSLSSVDYEILSALTQVRTAQVAYRVRLQTILVGEMERDTVMTLTLEGDQWRVQWNRGLILPEISGGNSLLMDYRTPSRGNIYDRQGRALVAQADAVSIGLIAGQTDPTQEDELLHQLWLLTGIYPDTIREKLDAARDGWYVPLAEVVAEVIQARFDYLSTFDGLVMEPYRSRYYFSGGIAPQVIGYVSQIQPEEVETYRRLGYQQDERVGRTGVEKWGEAFLAGMHGGALYAITPEGEIITRLAESDPEPAQSLYTTIDKNLQLGAQQALEGFLGAIVVMERDTGRILAIASSPGYDPNLFEPTNYNSSFLLTDLLNDPSTPLLNRATQGQYPLGSVFKIVTMSAALTHTFSELPGAVRYDWTYWYGVPASGLLTLPEGLMRSCNPFFWHIGLDFYRQGLDTAISDMARGFGLGDVTGIEQVVEAPGQILDPQNEVDAINFAIGQGDTLVTPLQVVNFVAAIGNGGNLMLPQIIERVESPDGAAAFTFEPMIKARLPVSKRTLSVVRSAMESVINDSDGTAYWRFINFPIPLAGKTGTAEAPPNDPHAWFTGYTLAGWEDRPDIAVVVVLEHAGEGSEVAAPIFKRMVEIYFFENPISLLPWESETDLPPPP